MKGSVGGGLIELKKEREKAAVLPIEDLLCRRDESARPRPCNGVWGKSEGVWWRILHTFQNSQGMLCAKQEEIRSHPSYRLGGHRNKYSEILAWETKGKDK